MTWTTTRDRAGASRSIAGITGLTVVECVAAQDARPALSASAASAQLPFRRDADVPEFPVAGVIMLAVLLALAVASVWLRKRSRGPTLVKRVGDWGGWKLGAASSTESVRVLSSSRLDAQTRLHVIEWQSRQLLVAVQPGVVPVVLDRIEAKARGEGGET